MTFMKRLLGRREKKLVEPLHGGVSARQADAEREEQGAGRKRMEAQIASDRERRGATDVRPVDSPP